MNLSTVQNNFLGTLKLMITGQRIPLSLVQCRYDNNQWISMHRSGDGYEPSVWSAPCYGKPSAHICSKILFVALGSGW